VAVSGTVPLTGTGTDSDGTVVSYSWNAGGYGSLSPTTGTTTTWTAPASTGFYTITLTVTDDDSATGNCTKTIQVILPTNNPPTCSISGASSVAVGGTVPLTGTGTDNDGTVVSYSWNAGGYGSLSPTTGTTTTWTAPASTGTYTITLTVIDDDNATGNCTKAILVTNTPPTCSSITASPSSTTPGGVVTLTASTTGTGLTYSWTNNGGTFSSSIANPTSWTAPATAGTYTVNLAVTNSGGTVNCPSKAITVALVAAPTCTSITASPSSTTPGGVVTLTASTTGTGLTYSWTKTGGTFSSTTTNPTNWTAPATAGTYTVSLTVTNSGGSANCSKDILVTTEPPAPSACRSGILYIEGSPGDTVEFNNSFTTDGNPLLIVTDLPVNISKNVGVSSSLTGTFNFPITQKPNIEVAILTSSDITVESDSAGDKVIMFQGPFVSMNQIFFNRDVGTQNSKTPAQAVKYDPIFFCECSKQERDHPEVRSYTGLGIFTVQWDYSE
jgi:PKD repeat protein